MLHNYFHSQQQHNAKTNERLQKLNQLANRHVKPPNHFNTHYGGFQNTFFSHLEKLREHKALDDEGNVPIRKDIHSVHMVYQTSFINIGKTTGLGDFIRGCLYVSEFCEKHRLQCQFHIKNHHLQKYLKHFATKPTIADSISKRIHKYLGLNAYFTCKQNKIEYALLPNKENDFISYLNECVAYNGNVFMNTTNFPLHHLTESTLSRTRSLFEPTDELQQKVQVHMADLELSGGLFMTYHIRLGDNYLNDPENTHIHLRLVQTLVEKMNVRPDYTYFLISDTPFIKNLLMSKFPNLKCIFFDISHVCENNASTIQNTLIEFYIMMHSKAIVAMSVYPHGSGFSKWCSVLYNIPYVCYLLPTIIYR